MFKKLILSISFFALVNAEDYSLKFDGEDDYVQTTISSDDLGGATSLTIDFTLKLNSGGNYQGVVGSLSSNNAQFGVIIQNDNSVQLRFYNSNGLWQESVFGTLGGLSTGEWYSIKVHVSQDQVKWYLDGDHIETDEVSFQALITGNANIPVVSIGRGNITYGEHIDGNISQIKISVDEEATFIADWNFNEGSGPLLLDNSGNNNHGIIYGAEWSDDVPTMDPPPIADNYSLKFDGEDDYIDCGIPSNDFNITSDNITWSVSFKLLQTETGAEIDYSPLIGQEIGGGAQNKWMLFYAIHEDRFGIHIYGPGLPSQWIYSDNISLDYDTYYHLRLNKIGTSYNFYLNESLIGSSSGSSNIPYVDAPMYIGKGWEYFSGNIEEIKIWDTNVDNVGETIFESDLIAYWDFNQGSGPLLLDHSGNNNHGIIYGAEWSDDVPSLDPPDDPNVIDGFTFVGDHNGHRYYISDQGGNYLNGLELCEQNGGHLVTVTSQEENNFVIDALMAYGGGSNHLWLGLDDLDGDGIYHWVTNEPLVYTNFSQNPSPGQAIEMSTPDGHWNDTPIDDGQDYRRYMLEVPGGNPPPPPSEENHSLSFDGGSDYVEINSNNDIVSSNNGVSINLYFKKQDFGGHQFLYDWGVYSGANISDALRMKIDNGGVLEAWVEGNPGYNAPSLTYDLNSNEMDLQDTWVQVSVVYGMSRSKLYVNGSLVSEVTNGMSDNDLYRIFDQSGAWYWIGDQGDNQYGFSGLIDEFSIWSKELSDLDVQSIQNMALSPNEENLVAYWKFNEGQGNIVHDQSGNDYHGAVHGAEWSDDGAPVMPSSIAAVEVGTAQAAPNSEVLVPVFVDLMYESVSSVEISFSGFHDQMEFVGLETEGTMTGDAEWSSAVNSEEDLLLTLTYGANEIVGVGTLFHLKFQVLDNVTGEFIPVVIEYVQMDELDGHIDVMNGGVELYDLDWGDVSQNGEISGFDASLILKHLVGMEELDELQLTVADVTQDNTISALDASAIAQYVVNMIDELPVANMDAMTGRGNFYFEELSLVPGELLEVPIQLINGDNLLSFEMEVDYDQETFTLEELVWSDLIEHFTVEENLESGSVKIAGMGATPDGQEGVFGTIRFYVNPDFSDPNTQVNIGYRINEQSAVDDVNLVIQNAVLGLENEMIPNEFTIGQNYPNPFNPTTRIDYGLPQESMVDITIYDMMGRLVSKLVKSRLGAGYHSVTWNATNNAGDPVSAGMYFYTVQAGEYRVTNKMLLLK